MKNTILLFIILFASFGCNKSYKSKTFHEDKEKTINVKDKIVDIETDLYFGICDLEISDSLLIVSEIDPRGEKGVHLLNKNSLKYLTSTGYMGKGPGEIIRSGNSTISFNSQIIWVDDYGKMVKWKFPIDSVMNNNKFIPTQKIAMNKDLFQVMFKFISDSVTIGKSCVPTSFHSMDLINTKRNIYSNKIEKYGYHYPDLKDRESYSDFALSNRKKLYVTCYKFVDLMTVCNLNGDLRSNIFGPKWKPKEIPCVQFYKHVDFYKDYIIASYLGDKWVLKTADGGMEYLSTSKFLVFDINGNYIKTIEVGYEFSEFCVDEDNGRIIVYFDGRKNPLGYFNLDL